MTDQSDTTVAAIIEDLRTRMPTLEQMLAIADNGTLGPDVQLPAVWMHILLSHIELLGKSVRRHELLAVGALPRHDPPLPEDRSDYAAALAKHASYACGGDGGQAASVLIQGALAILTTTLPPEAVIEVVENLVDIFDLRSKLGLEATRQ